MSLSRCSSLKSAAIKFCLAVLLAVSVRAQQVVYNNTNNSLNFQIVEKTEFGSELLLAGTARSLRELSFEYYGDFIPQGDEMCKVRIYSNETKYDIYRNEPTTLLYESDFFPIQTGYNIKLLDNLNIPLRDVVTFTIESRGLGEDEGMGLLLYNPPTVGRSFSELWRRNPSGKWQAVIYQLPRPDMRVKISVRLTAENSILLTSPKRLPDGKLEFGINGANGAEYIVEQTTDFNTWTPVARKDVPSRFTVHQQGSTNAMSTVFYRVRLEK